MKEYSESVPVQYQEKRSNFMDLDLYVDERTFIPRPETELLVNVVLSELKSLSVTKPQILELCTGSGAISIALAKNLVDCEITAIEVSKDALDVAEKNIVFHALSKKIALQHSDLYEAVKDDVSKFNCIVTNPPYVSTGDYEKVDSWVKAEPSIALLAGEEGLDCIYEIIKGAGKYLFSDGFLAIEIGYDQAEKVKDIFKENGFSKVQSYVDFNGFERVIIGWING